MMQRKGTASGVLMMALAGFAGCSQTESKVGQTAQRRWRPIDNESVMKARNAPTPKIAPETHLAAGVLLEQQGQPGQAIEQYRRAIALNHDYAEAYHRLGVLYGMTGQHMDAEKNLRKAVALKPQQAFFRNDLGFELMQRHDWAQAEEQFRAALDLFPRMPRANVNLGLAVSQQGRFDEALACFRTALPEADAQYNLGLVYKQQQRYAEASNCFQRALSERPQFAAANTQLAICAQNMGGQPTPTFTQVSPSFAQSSPQSQPQSNPYISQRNDSTIPVTTSGEPRPRTLASQTIPEDSTSFGPPQHHAAPAPQQVEWIEVQTSNGPESDDPITTPSQPQSQPYRVEPAPTPAPRQPQQNLGDFQSSNPPPMSRPEPMAITTSGGYESPMQTQQQSPRQSQPATKPQPASSPRTAPQPMTPSPSNNVQVVPMYEVGDARPVQTQPATFTPSSPTSQHTTATTSNARPDQTTKSMTPEEFRVWQGERRGQAIWLEEQRTGNKVQRQITYRHEPKYQTQIVTHQPVYQTETRSTMAATVDFTNVDSRGQGPLPAERPFEWLDTMSHDNPQLQTALNNLRCESLYGPTELDYTPVDTFNTAPPQVTIVPPETPAMPLEFTAPSEPRRASRMPTSTSTFSTRTSNQSGEKIVPLTDAK